MTGTDVARFTHKSVPVIFEPPCIYMPVYQYIFPDPHSFPFYVDNVDNICNYATLLIIMAYFSIFFTEFSETIFNIGALLQIFIRVDKYSSVKPFFTSKIKEIRYC